MLDQQLLRFRGLAGGHQDLKTLRLARGRRHAAVTRKKALVLQKLQDDPRALLAARKVYHCPTRRQFAADLPDFYTLLHYTTEKGEFQ